MDQHKCPPGTAANRHAFVVRIWREAGSPSWRGSVQQVSSGQTASFDSLEKLLAFLAQHIASLADQEGKGLK